MTLMLSNTAGASGTAATITPQTFVHSGSGSMRTAGRVFQTDGTTNWRRTFTFVQFEPTTDWIIPNNLASSSYEVRLTNLNWITKDEGFTVTPSGVVAESDATTLAFSGSTITRVGGTSFITLGFVAGQTIRIDRSTSNNNDFLIAGGGVASSTIIVVESLNAEGASATATMHTGGWINSTTDPINGDSDGDEDVWFDLGTRREWVFVDNDSDIVTGLQHAQFDFQIRIGTTIIATGAMDWLVNSAGGGGGGGGGGGCFVTGEKFQMEGGSLKEVQDIVPGDIMKAGGKVYQVIVGDGTVEEWYDVDGVPVTGHHGVYIDDEWIRVRHAGFDGIAGTDKYYVVANDNHMMLHENGQLFSDFQEVDYMATGWDDWVIEKRNGRSDDDAIREAIEATGVKSENNADYYNREGIYKEDYYDAKDRLLKELDELERLKKHDDESKRRPRLFD